MRIRFKAEELHDKSLASDCWLECPTGAFRSYGLPLMSGQLSSIAILDVQVELPKYVRPERAAEPNWTSIYELLTLLNRVREKYLPAQEYKHLELSALDFRIHFFKRTIIPPHRSSYEPFRI